MAGGHLKEGLLHLHSILDEATDSLVLEGMWVLDGVDSLNTVEREGGSSREGEGRWGKKGEEGGREGGKEELIRTKVSGCLAILTVS